MNKPNNKVPSNLTLVASVLCGLTIVLDVIYIVLFSVAIYFRSNCDAGSNDSQASPGSSYFLNQMRRFYFTKDACNQSIALDSITQEQTVFLLVTLSLTVSIASLISAISFLVVLMRNIKSENVIEAVGYGYISVCIVSLIMELTAAVFFGMDYGTLTDLVNNSSPGVSINYGWDMLRLGAFLLMTISLKGFFLLIKIVLIVLVIVFLVEFRKTVRNGGHSIHKMGALNAYDQPRHVDGAQSENSFQQSRPQQKRNDDPWPQTPDSMYPPYSRGAHVNPMFINDEPSPRILNHDRPRSENSNPVLDRSFSWHHNQPSVAARPFSYLEDKPRTPVKPPVSPKPEPQWPQNNWQSGAPPVPAPDYSPETPRRLKSALKSSYM